MKDFSNYESPDMEILLAEPLRALCQSVNDPSGGTDDFEWGTLD